MPGTGVALKLLGANVPRDKLPRTVMRMNLVFMVVIWWIEFQGIFRAVMSQLPSPLPVYLTGAHRTLPVIHRLEFTWFGYRHAGTIVHPTRSGK